MPEAQRLCRELRLPFAVLDGLSQGALKRIEDGRTPRRDAVVLLVARHRERRRR